MATQQLLFDSNKHNIHYSQLIPLCRSMQKFRKGRLSVGLQDSDANSPSAWRAAAVKCCHLCWQHLTAAACLADWLWVYLDSSEPVQTTPLGQLQQKHGHEVVAALLITAEQCKDDSRVLLADYLDALQQQLRTASGLHRSASVPMASPGLSPVSKALLDVPATPRSVADLLWGCRQTFNAAHDSSMCSVNAFVVASSGAPCLVLMRSGMKTSKLHMLESCAALKSSPLTSFRTGQPLDSYKPSNLLAAPSLTAAAVPALHLSAASSGWPAASWSAACAACQGLGCAVA